MSWIENGPKKNGGDFSSINSFLPKLKRYVLDISVLLAVSKNANASILICLANYLFAQTVAKKDAKLLLLFANYSTRGASLPDKVT